LINWTSSNTLCSAKCLFKRTKRQATNVKKIFTSDIFNKGLVLEYIKNAQISRIKKLKQRW
jgi:hypothetical protein